jgi:hypothetical protein
MPYSFTAGRFPPGNGGSTILRNFVSNGSDEDRNKIACFGVL